VVALRDRYAAGATIRALATEVDYSISGLHKVLVGNRWLHVPMPDRVARRERGRHPLVETGKRPHGIGSDTCRPMSLEGDSSVARPDDIVLGVASSSQDASASRSSTAARNRRAPVRHFR
jgi:hypothetical protein